MWKFKKKDEVPIDFSKVDLNVLEAYANESKNAQLIIQVNTLREVRAIRELLEEEKYAKNSCEDRSDGTK